MLGGCTAQHRCRSARTIVSYTFVTRPNHFCAHAPRVSPHQFVQLARAQFRQLPEHQTGMSVQELQPHMAAHDASKAVRASVTTVPSFLKQNGLMYGVIRRQGFDKRGLTTGDNTAMVSNRTAITSQSVLEPLSPRPDCAPAADFAGSSCAWSCAAERHIKQSVRKSWRGQSRLAVHGQRNSQPEKIRDHSSGPNKETDPLIVPIRYPPRCLDIFSSLRAAFIFQGKRAFASFIPYGHDCVIVLAIAVLGKLVPE